MAETVDIAFEQQIILLALGDLLPLRTLSRDVARTVKYKRIVSSIAEVGVIEPLAVARRQDDARYLILDGHLRYFALGQLGQTTARCLIATDDEAFTYNKRVNRLATIQEHFMIVRALERGIPEEKLARALNVDTRTIQRRRTLLDGISPDVVELLKDKAVNPLIFEVLKKLKPMRQLEAAELMVSVGNYTVSYAKALLAATRSPDLARPDKPKTIRGLSPQQIARMEREMATLNRDFKALEASFGDDVLHLVIAAGYLSRLLSNPAVARYLERDCPEILEEFRAIVGATSLDMTGSLAA